MLTLNQRKHGLSTIILDKADFRTNKLIRDKRHYVIIKGSVQKKSQNPKHVYT